MINNNINNIHNRNFNLSDKINNNFQYNINNKEKFILININIEYIPIKNTNNIINNKTLTFAINNIYGLNNSVKNKQIIDTFIQQEIDFVGLTETHHKQQHELQCKDQHFYDSF